MKNNAQSPGSPADDIESCCICYRQQKINEKSENSPAFTMPFVHGTSTVSQPVAYICGCSHNSRGIFVKERTTSRDGELTNRTSPLCRCKTELEKYSHSRKPTIAFSSIKLQSSSNVTAFGPLLKNIHSFYLLFIKSPSFFQMFYTVFTIILLTQLVTTNAYVLTQEGRSHTYLHRRLSGRERRDVQREILSILGLDHKPRITGQQGFEKSSAPLYMLGLYSTASSLSKGDFTDVSQSDLHGSEAVHSGATTQQRLQSRSANRYPKVPRFTGPFAVDPVVDMLPSRIETELNRYIEDSGILTKEVGVFEFNHEQSRTLSRSSSNGVTNHEEERQLLDQSDLVISFINTRQRHSLSEDASPSNDLKLMLRRHRSFFFDINKASAEDDLTAAKFRLYKEVSDGSLGNQTLRVDVHQTEYLSDGSADVHLLGSRLVGSNQEGWLVYDVTSALRDWLNRPASNLGLKVTVENIEGRYLKPTKTGLVGRKGPAAKQAFVVAFFSQNQDVRLHEHIRRRVRRSPDSSLTSDDGTREEDDELVEDDDEENGNDTEDNTEEGTVLDAEEVDGGEMSNEASSTTTTNIVPEEDASEEDTRSRRKIRAKAQKPKKKSRKRKRPKNSSKLKRKPTTEHCHRKPLYVNFRDLGWDTWIIAPEGYSANQCIGECSFPLNAQMNATNHAIVQSLVHLSLPHMKIPQPCCSPTILDPISVLYYNDKTNVVYKKYQNMIVSSCGCH